MSEVPDNVDPAIAELFKKLPKPGEMWTVDKRVRWLRALAGIIQVVYESGQTPEGDILITRGSYKPEPPL